MTQLSDKIIPAKIQRGKAPNLNLPATFRVAFVLLILVTLLGMSAASVLAQTETPPPTLTGVGLKARAASDGYFKYGEWLPIWVELDNTGPDRRAEVRAPITTSAGIQVFTVPVELPAGARKRLAVYVLPNNFSRQVEVSVVSGDEVLASQKVQLSPQPTITYQVGLLSAKRGALSLLETIDLPGTKRPIVLVDLSLAELPDRYEGLRSFDLLVINDVDTSSLSPAQVAALDTWVRQGGRLVVAGGAGAERTLSGLTELSSLDDLATQEVDKLTGLEQFIGGDKPILVPGPFLLASGTSQTTRTLAEQDDQPIIQEWAADQGWINYVGLDLTGAPFDAWNGTVDFWQKLVSPGAAFPEGAPVDMSARQQFASGMVYPLNNLPMLDLPSVRGLALLLGLYILLVGPVNYLVLRQQKRLHLAWITIPVITLIFSAASFGVGYLLHGTDIFINKIAIWQPQPTGKAKVDSFIGLFSPARSAYSVRLDESGLVSPLNPYMDPWTNPDTFAGTTRGAVTLIQAEPAYINGLSVDQWSMQSFLSEGAQIDFGQLQADLTLDNDRIVGELRNESNFDLKDATLLMGTRFARLGDLPRGATIPIDMQLATPTNPNLGQSISYSLYEKEISGANGPIPRQVEVKRAIIETLFERTPPYISSKRGGSQNTYINQTPVLVGWLDQAPPQVTLDGAQPAEQTTAAVVQPLDLKFPESGPINLPPGMIPGRLAEMPREGGQCGMPGTTAVYIIRGEALFEFTLPPEIQDIAVDNLKLTLYNDSGLSITPDISLLNPETGDWIQLDGINQGVNLIPDASSFVDPSGMVKIKLAAENLSNCFYLSLGMDGHR
jgi:hypothetical protein